MVNNDLTPPSFSKKILSPEECIKLAQTDQLPRPLVFTNGVFDILHRGHVSYLDVAASLGACLVVAINTDASVKTLNKGDNRPINTLEDRAAVLAALSSTDIITSFNESNPEEIIKKIRPNIIVKGGDYDMELLPETAIVRSWGGSAFAIPIAFDRSTTELVKKIRS